MVFEAFTPGTAKTLGWERLVLPRRAEMGRMRFAGFMGEEEVKKVAVRVVL
jgi:hypothetical protein